MTGTAMRRRIAGVLLALCPAAGAAQPPDALAAKSERAAGDPAARPFASRADSLEWVAERARAGRARGFRLVVSLRDRRLWAMIDDDTLLAAPIAVASDSVLEYQGRRWVFTTPRGVRTVLRKDSLPEWVPPDWHYYEVARRRGLFVRPLLRGRPVALADGRWLGIRGDLVGVADADSVFVPLPPDEEIIFDGYLFIPPLGTRNRRIAGELGRYRLDLRGVPCSR